MELDETDYDAIVVGTGFLESVVAASLARAGQKVLHLDPNGWYGGHEWSTLTLAEFRETIGPRAEERINPNAELGASRNYAIDLSPWPMMSADPLVKLLVASGVGRYLEFKVVDNVYLHADGEFRIVPSSKGEVFKSKLVSGREKGKLLQFMRVMLPDDGDDTVQHDAAAGPGADVTGAKVVESFTGRPFVEYLDHHGLSVKVQRLVLRAIAMEPTDHPETLLTEEGLQTMKTYLTSVGRFGHTAFLYPHYGTSEVVQAFCRVCAVYSGTYVLRRSIQSIHVENEIATGVVCTEGQTLTCRHLVTSQQYLPNRWKINQSPVQRCVVVLDDVLLEGREAEESVLHGTTIGVGQHSVCLATVPPEAFGTPQCIYITQLTTSIKACPAGRYLIHFITRDDNGEGLRRCVDRLIAVPPPTPAPTKPDETAATTDASIPDAPPLDLEPTLNGDAATPNAKPDDNEAADATPLAPNGDAVTTPADATEAPISAPLETTPTGDAATAEPVQSGAAGPIQDSRPSALYAAFFQLDSPPLDVATPNYEGPLPSNVHVVPGANGTLRDGYSYGVAQAMFETITPEGTDFLEKLPDPYEAMAAQEDEEEEVQAPEGGGEVQRRSRDTGAEVAPEGESPDAAVTPPRDGEDVEEGGALGDEDEVGEVRAVEREAEDNRGEAVPPVEAE